MWENRKAHCENSGDSGFEALVEECLAALDVEGPAALERICAQRPECAPGIRARVTPLMKAGLVGRSALDQLPQRLGEFQILGLLGRGGMGVVYRALQTSIGREVALKVVRPDYLFLPGTRERFLREVEVIANLRHPAIAPVYSVGEENGVPFFAMEYVEGLTLEEIVLELRGRPAPSLRGEDLVALLNSRVPGSKEQVPSPWSGPFCNVALHIASQVALALEHAHHRGVRHRDVKPSNIMITPAGRVLLMDFGLASTPEASNLTASGAQVGTLAYMPPERARGEPNCDPVAGDVYGLGVTLYELLTLQQAFAGAKNQEATRRLIINGAPQRPRVLNPGVSWEAEVVCLTAMELDPARRYRTAAALADDLVRAAEQRPLSARRPGPILGVRRWIARHQVATVGSALGLVAVLALVWSGSLLGQTRAAEVLAQDRGILDSLPRIRETGARYATGDQSIDRFSWIAEYEGRLHSFGFDLRSPSAPTAIAAFCDAAQARNPKVAATILRCLYDLGAELIRSGVVALHEQENGRQVSPLPNHPPSYWRDVLAAATEAVERDPGVLGLWQTVVDTLDRADHDPWRRVVWSAWMDWATLRMDRIDQLPAATGPGRGDDLTWYSGFVRSVRGPEAAIPVLERAVAEDPGSFWAHFNLALLIAGRPDEGSKERAFREASCATALDPDSAWAWTNRGAYAVEYVLLIQARASSAGQKGRTALEAAHSAESPGREEELGGQAKVYQQEEEALQAWAELLIQDAEDSYRTACALASDQVTARSNWANLIGNKDPEQAEVLHRQALEIEPCSYASLMSYGAFLRNTGRLAEELEVRQRLVDCDPTDLARRFELAYLCHHIANTHRASDQHDAQITHLERACEQYTYILSLSTDLVRCEQRLAIAQIELGNVGAGLASLDRMLSLYEAGLAGSSEEPSTSPDEQWLGELYALTVGASDHMTDGVVAAELTDRRERAKTLYMKYQGK